MERDWSGNARRLSEADRAEIERRIWSGETFASSPAIRYARSRRDCGGHRQRSRVRSPGVGPAGATGPGGPTARPSIEGAGPSQPS
jgi:hypothetical protein